MSQSATGEPCVLIRTQLHVVHYELVAVRAESQCLWTVVLIDTPAVLKVYTLDVVVVGLDVESSTVVDSVSVVTARAAVVGYGYEVLVLTDDVDVRLPLS